MIVTPDAIVIGGTNMPGISVPGATGSTVPFSFAIANDEGSYKFDFPKVQVAGDWPDGGNTEIIQVQLDITAADVSPTITRKAAASADDASDPA